MKKSIFYIIILVLVILISCQQITQPIYITLTWKGTLSSAPENPEIGWAYYNSSTGCSYIWDGIIWNIIAQNGADGTDGTSNTTAGYLILWKGSLTTAPLAPESGWAYYNSTDKKSYIYDGSSWQILAQDGMIENTVSSASNYLQIMLNTNKGNYVQANTQIISSVDFGQIGLGSTSKSKLFYIGLNGTTFSTLHLTGSPLIQISGDDADQFTVTQPSTNTVDSGYYILDACIAFTPTSIGTKTATITIPNDSPDKPNFSFTVTGTGSYWPKTYDSDEGDGYDCINKLLTDSAGNLYAIGYGWELENDHSGFDWWIKMFNSTGIQQWEKVFDFYDDNSSSYSPYYDNPTQAIIDSNDDIIISSKYNTVKLNSSGTVLWQLSLGGNIVCDATNNVFIGNKKYDSNGTFLWMNELLSNPVFDTSDNAFCVNGNEIIQINTDGSNSLNPVSVTGITNLITICLDNSNNIYVAGYNTNKADTYSKKDIVIKKFTSSGTEITSGWNKVIDYGHCDDEVPTKLIFDGTNIIMVGTGNDSISGASASDGLFYKYNTEGTLITSFELSNAISYIKKDSSDNYFIISGSVLSKYSTIGSYIWSKSLNITSPCLTIDEYDNIYIGGYGYNLISNNSSYDWYMMKFSSSGIEQ